MLQSGGTSGLIGYITLAAWGITNASERDKTSSVYAMCEGIRLWHIVKVPSFKVPTQIHLGIDCAKALQVGTCGTLGHCMHKRNHKNSLGDGAAFDASEDAVEPPPPPARQLCPA